MNANILTIAVKLNEASNHLIHAAIDSDDDADDHVQNALTLVCEILCELDEVTKTPELEEQDDQDEQFEPEPEPESQESELKEQTHDS